MRASCEERENKRRFDDPEDTAVQERIKRMRIGAQECAAPRQAKRILPCLGVDEGEGHERQIAADHCLQMSAE